LTAILNDGGLEVEFGIKLPNSGPFARVEGIRFVAEKAEEYGFDSVWAHDHVHRSESDAEHHFAMGAWEAWDRPIIPNVYEPLATLSFIAGFTRRVKLGTSAVVMSLRNPTWLAKETATLDQLSQGRVVLGLVTGGPYLGRELGAIGRTELLGKRGRIAEEWLDILRGVWTADEYSYTGDLIEITDAIVFPKPAQDLPPVLLGGFSDATLDRITRKADGWLPVFATPDAIRRGRGILDAGAEKLDRPPRALRIISEHWLALDSNTARAANRAQGTTGRLSSYITSHPKATANHQERLAGREKEYTLAGNPEVVAAQIREDVDAGADSLILRVIGQSFAEIEETMHMFRDDVRPRLEGATAA
jgi:probable F420-dependent oxidoreductase